MNTGHIYKITNKLNGLVYIGQTTRDIDTRFSEHCFDKRSNSLIHEAIVKDGWKNFKIDEIEKAEIDKLDEREKFWIKEYNSFNPEHGYNRNKGGIGIYCKCVQITENGLIVKSKEDLCNIISSLTSWNISFLRDKITKAISTGSTFLDYHLIQLDSDEVSSIDEIENWIKTLNVRYAGKHIYCLNLNREFSTVGEAARFLFDNGYYSGNSKMPIQEITSSIGRHLKKHTDGIITKQGLIKFEEIPGSSTKNSGAENPCETVKVFCKELNKTFDSEREAAKYMIDNKYWINIKMKTCVLRISDMINGNFESYKGYSFVKVN